ncbi:hypothetical protein B0T11DRAFT_349995 [Plectosphaerella cucumerina]|uniref:Monooxygenase n=1 Tax=Plectosphaerella cucumerina TaxID=40658 RepID=A0A8K0TMS5_9PEZI|nr:hypothetical protein B0T11DRAFT_349995 [Plectosphaerella cucumerina]
MSRRSSGEPSSYSQFACIGTGVSGIALGATLKRWYGITDIEFFDRNEQLGGTWITNQYPGCACDVPSVLYSFSFEPHPGWSRMLPSHDELWRYLDGVASKYDLQKRMTFGVNVEHCEWVEERARWRLTVRGTHGVKKHVAFVHEAQFLFSATGQFCTPRRLDTPGIERFQGPIVHTAEWDHDINLDGKRVVVFGNGCTGAQVVPQVAAVAAQTTHIVRSKHWILPPIDAVLPPWFQTALKWIPGFMFLFRYFVFSVMEKARRGVAMTEEGQVYRDGMRQRAEKYMREAAPPKYLDMLLPDFEVGCRRRIFDSGYLPCLHADNMRLTDAPVSEIVENGVVTRDGLVEADAIVLATGFETNNFLSDIELLGEGGQTLADHWKTIGTDGAGAYNCTVMSGFPNFFAILGPNSGTGHTSAVMAAENCINYALRVLRPVLQGKASIASVRPEAERDYVETIQRELAETVFNQGGCNSWYVREAGAAGGRWNGSTYPRSQADFWYRSLFPQWSHWEFRGPRTTPTIASNGPTLALIVLVTGLIIWLLNNDDATAMVERLARAGMARLSLAQEVS